MDSGVIEETPMLVDDNENENKLMEENDKRINFYAQRMKMAVAMAVITSTPPEMTPKEYASHLVQCCKEDGTKWKKKCETLERELLVLEQKLETVTLKEKFNLPDMDLSLVPLSSALVRMPQPLSTDIESKISTTIEFVRSFVFLGSLSNETLEENGEKTKLKEKVLRSVALLFEYLRSHEGLSLEFSIVKSSLDEVHRLFESKANFFEKDLVDLSVSFVESLLLDIYKTLELNMVEFQHRRSALIQMLAEQRKLTALVLSILLREITILSDSLTTVLQSDMEDATPLLRMENAYYVLQTAEGTLHIMLQQRSCLNVLRIPKSLLLEWNKTTERSLLDIGSLFPMYSIYIWHIKTLLQSALDTYYEN